MRKKTLVFSILLNLLFVSAFIYIVHSLGGISYLVFKMRNKGVAGVYEHRKNLFQNLPMKEGGTVFLGNSIIEQCEWAELLEKDNIYNRGIAGDVSDGILNRLNAIIKAKPAQLFLMVGINDLLFGGQKKLLENYPKMISQIKEQSPATKIYIHSILPINNSVRNIDLSNEVIVNTNKVLKALAEKEDANYINLYDLLKDEQGALAKKYTKDGIHINGEGYLIWKQVIQQLVNE